MSFSVALHSSPRLAALRFTGRVTPLDVRDACLRLLDLADWQPGTAQVWDFSDATELNVDPDGWAMLLAASQANQTRIGKNRVAVVSRDPNVGSFLELYAHTFRRSGRTFRLAETSGQAREWLEEDERTVLKA